MYFDEDLLLDIRLNELNSLVKKFIIVESQYTHSGNKRNLLFDINKYSKFKNKIEYIILKKEPDNLHTLNKNDNFNEENSKYILNAAFRENLQRNTITEGLNEANPNDIIIISDLDEIPRIHNVDFKKINKKFIFFKQKNYYYKFNLFLKNFEWIGSKACRLKDLKSPQWLRNIKDKNYPFWRIDTFFSKNKSSDIHFVDDGGWHFSYLKTAENIEKKLKSYLHHREYDLNPLGLDKIKEMIANRIAIYDLKTDMRKSKFRGSQKLTLSKTADLPIAIRNNLQYYQNWLAK